MLENEGMKMLGIGTGVAGALYALRKPLKKAIVLTISGAFIAADRINEAIGEFKENVGDVIAEAKYENIKMQMNKQKEA